MDRRKLLGLAAVGTAGVLVAARPVLAGVTKGLADSPAVAPTNPGDPALVGDSAVTGGDAPAPAPLDPADAAVQAPVEPVGGAGVFDVDPDQAAVSQDPAVVVTGDIAVMPEDWEF